MDAKAEIFNLTPKNRKTCCMRSFLVRYICCMNMISWDESVCQIFYLKQKVGHNDIFHGPVIFPYILKTI